MAQSNVMPVTGSESKTGLHFRTNKELQAMNAQCKCGTPLEMSWNICPSCGVAVIPEVDHPGAPPEKNSLAGVFGGLLFGVIAAPVFLIVGIMLCLTGLGAFLGVPMIIVAILAPLAGPMFGVGEHPVRCPYCSTREITIADNQLHFCPNCEKEFALGAHHQVAKAS